MRGSRNEGGAEGEHGGVLEKNIEPTGGKCVVLLVEGDCRHRIDDLPLGLLETMALEDVGLLLRLVALVKHAHRHST